MHHKFSKAKYRFDRVSFRDNLDGYDIRFSENEKEKLKRPIGKLFKGEVPNTTIEVLKYISEKKPKKIIVVGDFSSRELKNAGLSADIYVVDGKIERKTVDEFRIDGAVTLKVRNPPGTISYEALRAIEKAFSLNRLVVISVDGEEDLLTLAIIAYAPLNSIVIYGQPKEGIVVVEVTKEKKEEVNRIIESAIESSK